MLQGTSEVLGEKPVHHKTHMNETEMEPGSQK